MRVPHLIQSRAAPVVVAALLAACYAGNDGSTAPTGRFEPAQAKSDAACAIHRLFVEYKTSWMRERFQTAASSCSSRAIVAARQQSSQIVTFDVPGSAHADNCSQEELFDDCGTQGVAINDAGTIVGVYLTTRLVLRAYMRTPEGAYRTFQAPGAGTGFDLDQGSVADNVTSSGIVGGYDLDSSYVYHAYLRRRNGSFMTYEVPYASQVPNDSYFQGTILGSTNVELDSAGTFFDSQGVDHGFIRYRNGTFARVSPPGAAETTVCSGDCLALHAVATGTFLDAAGNPHGYVRAPNDRYSVVTAQHGAQTYSFGINDGDEIVGAFADSSGIVWSYIRWRSGRFVTFQAPGAGRTSGLGTQAGAIDEAGAVTGAYADASGEIHGFVRSPTGRFAEFDPTGSIGTFPESIDASGRVTGVWYDSFGQNHGFIWLPR